MRNSLVLGTSVTVVFLIPQDGCPMTAEQFGRSVVGGIINYNKFKRKGSEFFKRSKKKTIILDLIANSGNYGKPVSGNGTILRGLYRLCFI
jgi:hypothetical protein